MGNVELLGIGMGIIGLALTVYFGVKSLGARQSLKSKGKGITIQSGRDTKINGK